MRVKLDENVHGDARDALAGWGHDMTTVHEQRLAGRPDADVAVAVKAEARCLVTLDLDLDFADTRRYPPAEFAGLVVLRLRVPTAKLQVRRLVSFFAAWIPGMARYPRGHHRRRAASTLLPTIESAGVCSSSGEPRRGAILASTTFGRCPSAATLCGSSSCRPVPPSASR